MNVLSLFDGIGCGQIALTNLKVKRKFVLIQVNKHFASETDQHTIKITQHNYPQTIQLGDVTKIKGSELPKIDLRLI